MFGFILAFIANKFLVRPYLLEQEVTGFFKVFVLSFPNLCEAVIGTLLLVNLALIGNQEYLQETGRWKEGWLYFIVAVLAAIYVILQEFKVHNLGGRNVFDPNDVLFSVIGLLGTYVYLVVKKPSYVRGTFR